MVINPADADKEIKEYKKSDDESETKIRLGDLSFNDVLLTQINRIIHCFSWVNNYASVQDYEQNTQTLVSHIEVFESFLSPYLNKKYWKSRKKIISTEAEDFEKSYENDFKNLNRDNPRIQKNIKNQKAIHQFRHIVWQYNIIFRDLLVWIEQNNLGFSSYAI